MGDENVEDLFRKERKGSNKRLSMSLPIPPSINSMYTMKRQYTAKARRWFSTARALINMAVEEQYWGIPAREEWLYVDLVFYMPDRKIRDSHNCLKILMDALQDSVFINDYFVLPRIQSVEYDKEHPRVEVLITHQTKNARERGLKMTHVVQ
jgi:crossover junction endodeoxyribonuclease RusA